MAIYKSDIVDINLESGSIHRSYLNHTIGSGDNSANRFGVRTFRNGLSEDLTGASCQAIFMNAAGTNIALTSYGTVSGNEAYVTLPQACYNVEGQFTLAIKLVKSGETVTTRIVDGVVCNTGTTGAVAPTSSVPTYQEILDVYAAMQSATSAANTAIAETFDATKAYPAGKYVINSGALYRLTADHVANVTWANTSKVAVNFGDELSSTKSALDYNYEPVAIGEIYDVFIVGGINGSGNTTSDSYRIRTKTMQKFPYNIRISCNDDNIYFIIHTYSDSTISSSSHLTSSGWKRNTNIIVPANTYFAIVVEKYPESYTNTITNKDIVDYASKLMWEGIFMANNYIYTAIGDLSNYVDLKGLWCYGQISSSGVPSSTAKYRVRNNVLLKFGFDVSISVESGYRFLVAYYSENSMTAEKFLFNSGWVESVVIPANVYFAIVVEVWPENTSLIADIDTYTAQLSFSQASLNKVLSAISDNHFQIENIKSWIGGFLNTISFGDNWVVSGINSSGVIQPYAKYRVINQRAIKLDYELQIEIAEGYTAGYHTYTSSVTSSSTHDSWSGWKTDKFYIPANTYFVIIIEEYPEDTSAVADLDTYVSALTISGNYVNHIIRQDVLNLIAGKQINDNKINEMYNIIDGQIGAELPPQWKDYMTSKIIEIQDKVMECSQNGDSFIFLTDYHIENNVGNSHLLVNSILKQTPIDKFVFGGDILNGDASKENAIAKMQLWFDRFHNTNPLGLKGNHEYNILDGGSSEVQLSESEIYYFLIKDNEYRLITDQKMSYYMDNENQKIRYIFIDSSGSVTPLTIDPETETWITSTIQNTPSGYTIVVFSHYMFNVAYPFNGSYDPGYHSNGQKVINAINAGIEANQNITVACVISGHTHYDYSKQETKGYWVICTTCDTLQDAMNVRTVGASTEQAFDVFSINTDSKKIYAVRVGAGNSRNFTYS